MTVRSIVRVATDVGGTFTDMAFVEVSEDGSQVFKTAKTDTTPPNFEKGVLDVLQRGGVDIQQVGFLAHGTTVVINALTERKGAVTGLITTEGFRDVLEIARGNRPDFFNLKYKKPAPFVPRFLRREIPGRITYRGEERASLDLTGLSKILDDFRQENVTAIAVCLLHSYTNSKHEKEVINAIRAYWPDVSVVASHQINREWREYERTNTTVLSAYVQPIAESYLSGLEEAIKKDGFVGSLYVMQSNCGVDNLSQSKRIPITMVESGPASGVLAAAELGKAIGVPNIIALDIGGTTAKCSLIENSEVKIVSDYWIEKTPVSSGYPVMVPVVDIVEIGNGGGSIAWVDEFKKLHVGPQSAGAMPGPAAYGKGGIDATTTDANLILNRINPDYFCGGEINADVKAAENAIRGISDQLGLKANETARGIIRIANNNMTNALKLVSLNRGYDPRDFTLVAFGGGGGLHAVALASELGIKNVIVPNGAAVFSAWGMIMSDLRRDIFVTKLVELQQDSTDILNELSSKIELEAVKQFEEEGVDSQQVQFRYLAKMRYQNQEHSVEVDIPDRPLTSQSIIQLEQDFHNVYEREYTYRLNTPVEIVGMHVVVMADIGKLEITKMDAGNHNVGNEQKGKRMVDYAQEGIHEATIYDGASLRAGSQFSGPAIIEDSGSTTVIHPDNDVKIDEYGNIHINLGVNSNG
tara:strand:- start:5920 stop:8007 length:2088 start_codon:yes stop_codon:yes gene_type:complete